MLPPPGKAMTNSTPEKEFLIAQPVTAHNSPTGRCTKGYVAYDLEEKRQCFLKDQWRTYTRHARPEWKTYQHLHSKGVKGIATAIAGGDVGPRGCPQRTQTQLVYNLLKLGPRREARVHSRLVTLEIGRPLEDYVDSVELFTACTHAFVGTFAVCRSLRYWLTSSDLAAHKQAWELAGVLHRDVSIGNIMINVEPNDSGATQGFLNDWDLCKWEEDIRYGYGPSQPTGISVSFTRLLWAHRSHKTMSLGNMAVHVRSSLEISPEATCCL